MPVGHRMITVQTPAHRIEMLVPDAITAAELVPELLDLIDGDASADRPAGGTGTGAWDLLRPGGVPMPVDQPLAALGVRTGDGLLLVPDGGDFRSPRILPALAADGRGRADAWTPGDTRAAFLLAALAAITASVLLSTDGHAPDPGTALVVAGVCALAAIGAGRAPRRGVFRTWVALSLALVGGLLAIGSAFVGPGAAATAGDAATVGIPALAVLAATGLPLLAVGLPVTRAVALAGAVAGLPATVVALVGWQTGTSLRTMAAVVVVVAVLLLRKCAAVAVAAHGLLVYAGHRARHHAPGMPSWWLIEPGQDATARAALTATFVGCAVALLPAGALLITGTTVERWILAAVVVILISQPRWLRFRAHRIVATVVAAAGIVLLVVLGLHEIGSPLLRVAVLGLAAVSFLALTARRRPWPRLPWLARAGEIVEVLAVMALVPLLAQELGLFNLANRLVHRWVG